MPKALNKWVDRLEGAELPALDQNLEILARLSLDENVPVERLAAVIERDPALTIRLLRQVSAVDHKHLRTEVTTVTHAVMMLGLSRVRDLHRGVPTMGTVKEPLVRRHLLESCSHAYHAATQAYDWARLRKDMEPDEIFMVTLLHNVGEMLLWRFAPKKMLQIETLTQHEGMEPEEAQYVVLGFGLDQLTMGLAQRWRLPSLLIDSLHPENAQKHRVLGIMLAVQLARKARRGWYRPSVTSVLEQATEYLHRDLDEITRRIHMTAVEAARASEEYQALPAAALLLLPPGAPVITVARQKPGEVKPAAGQAATGDGRPPPFCLAPRTDVFRRSYAALGNLDGELSLHQALAIAMEGMHDGLGLNRVVFAMLTPDRGELKARSILGSDNDPLFNRFAIDIDGVNLFARLLDKPQAIWVNDGNRARFWPLVPNNVQKLIRINSFFAMSVFVKGKPVGIFYADRHTQACTLEEATYKRFKGIAGQAAATMERISNNKPEQ